MLKPKFQKLKKHIPTIVTGAIAIASTCVAVYYRNRVTTLENIDKEYAWIGVSHQFHKEVLNGAVLKYRASESDAGYYSQATTLENFPEEANKAFEKFKDTGEMDPCDD